ncbi:DNA cross-link repair 1A protein [Fulvia fulva]|uniref:DNA cross-link repair 1A protein n=1 Tax=Passalora fulva TaxID=5499 RepID=A0A9Q8L5L4_PASFU|nr:DNA cross-link repair 1A protein [Fulvia fulva]KAK4636358.1 DNA cross-link repair 1A protein [Fulvia fulva]UJO11261.1 DNA cross-link repair 1A protein [Fulvia fulva]
MFRKPRDTAATSDTGRPPSPPDTPAKTPFNLAVPPTVPPPTMATKAKPSKPVPLPTIGRQGLTASAKKSAATAKAKQNGKGNTSILSFFKKDDSNDGLFVGQSSSCVDIMDTVEQQSMAVSDMDDADDVRFNEAGGSVKRRKTSVERPIESEDSPRTPETPAQPKAKEQSSGKRVGPFFEESDSEQEEEEPQAVIGVAQGDNDGIVAGEMPQQASPRRSEINEEVAQTEKFSIGTASARPALMKEETSFGIDLDAFNDFDEGDFDEHPFEEGDEFRERRYMEGQARLEDEDAENDYDPVPQDDDQSVSPDGAATCPICSIGLSGVNERDAGAHVNNCLDGNPTPLPQKSGPGRPATIPKSEPSYSRPVRPAKPGQANPFELGKPSTSGGSAFNKLMSGHAENAAWSEAAASEHAARGKPSYTRTCPFYKILPGLFICVDAFRYGAVEGCKAYFLSHFHSDHYVGLTSTWSHGPIYCSKVTANLVRQQLRVDPQYVVPLDFEAPFEIPGTKGVKVTMISANHCPGSSLYLFEKTVGKKQNGEPRLQRILHCGDFRACRMHIEHPLLMPNVRDRLAGTTREQKIDVCYLDTTYLNPKYAFPSQEVVIEACADMCVSLSKHTPDDSDGWEQMKRQRAGEGMTRFIKRESHPEIKEEALDEDTASDLKVERNPHASQQILSSVTDQKARGRLLVVVGTYSIGKERIALGIAKALESKIYAPASKQRIVAALEDPELDSRMTNDPREAQVHLTPLFEIRAETLDDYLKDFFPHFTRAVGFRPSGWNYRPPNSRFTDSPLVQTVLHSDNWKSTYSMKELTPQRGSTSRASCFGVPYSEHSSFRELTMFCCALRIDKIIPTVNVGSAKSREKMKAWCERWAAERKKNGLYKLPEDGSW